MAEIPTNNEVERAILNEIEMRNVRAGEVVNIMSIGIALQKRGLRGSDINSALQRMMEAGLVSWDGRSQFLKLTDAGFAAM